MTYSNPVLTFKILITTAIENILIFYFWIIRLDLSCKSSARQQIIHMKGQALFSLIKKKKKKKYIYIYIHRTLSATILLSTLKVMLFRAGINKKNITFVIS